MYYYFNKKLKFKQKGRGGKKINGQYYQINYVG